MRGISFEYAAPVSVSDTNRMDVACFIGFISWNRNGIVPDALKKWWRANGWRENGSGESVSETTGPADRPVPVESWETFNAFFDVHRLTHRAAVKSRALFDPVTIAAGDERLDLIVDHRPLAVDISANGGKALSEIVDGLNGEFAGKLDSLVVAGIDSTPAGDFLTFKRTSPTRGELTVYANPSLGFPFTVQDDDRNLDSWLAVAVRAFFRQGGRKCYIVPMGDPLPYVSSEEDRFRKIMALFPDSGLGAYASGNHRLKIRDLATFPLRIGNGGIYGAERGRGLTHLMDLTDVSYVVFPDLVDLFAVPAEKPVSPIEKGKEEIFVSCSSRETIEPDGFSSRSYPAPRTAMEGYRVWKRFIDLCLFYLKGNAPNTQLLAGLPLPVKAAEIEFEAFILSDLFGSNTDQNGWYRGLQLAYPWVKTDRSDSLPESVEPPEGHLAGLLAGGAITDGAYRSIAGTPVISAYDRAPSDIDPDAASGSSGLRFADRVSFLDAVPGGIELISDVTAVDTPVYRYAVIRRIMMLVQRTAFGVGLSYVFENSGPDTWHLIESALSDLLMKIYQENGLWGATAEEAFSVVCDRTTMTANDIDNGRLIVNVSLKPAAPIERITVNLVLKRDGGISAV